MHLCRLIFKIRSKITFFMVLSICTRTGLAVYFFAFILQSVQWAFKNVWTMFFIKIILYFQPLLLWIVFCSFLPSPFGTTITHMLVQLMIFHIFWDCSFFFFLNLLFLCCCNDLLLVFSASFSYTLKTALLNDTIFWKWFYTHHSPTLKLLMTLQCLYRKTFAQTDFIDSFVHFQHNLCVPFSLLFIQSNWPTHKTSFNSNFYNTLCLSLILSILEFISLYVSRNVVLWTWRIKMSRIILHSMTLNHVQIVAKPWIYSKQLK